ncbi:nucleoside deoxyribosyltransferase [Gordonia phage Clown]|uniref:Nucleoside deoxyribosyltransferase n=1 Tax=Gordonia phage Clown TaxID=2759393 RepID=A0A7L7SIQ9_9CAUD|nr:hydrolase [Gordonia phage Clown]QOC56010.1 nucleoside deoxyribosyltransferase [Gordonia phage Clown]
MTIHYLAGPMTGYPEFNYPAFTAAAENLRAQGLTVVSPHELHDGDTGRSWEFYVRAGLRALLADGAS